MHRVFLLLAALTPCAPAVRLADGTNTLIDGNYTFGYLNATAPGYCHRVSMLKFPATNTGTAQTVNIAVIPAAGTETCTVALWLYAFPAQTQIGNSLGVSFSALGSATPTEMVALDVSAAGWVLTAGAEYYFMLQSFTWDAFGRHCLLTLPIGAAPISAVTGAFAVVTQTGPAGLPCGGTPWALDLARDGGSFLFSIEGTSGVPASPTLTPLLSPSQTATVGSRTVTLADSSATLVTANYSLGYLDAIAPGFCHRVEMLKFPCLASGTVSTLTFTAIPAPNTELCEITFWLSAFAPGGVLTPIGGSITVPFEALGSATAPAEPVTVDISAAAWPVTAGGTYTMTWQTFTYDGLGNRCHIAVPIGSMPSVAGSSPPWALVTQVGPAGQPCGATPWATDLAMDGGAIPIVIRGIAVTPSATPSAAASPSSGAAVGVSASGSPSPTATVSTSRSHSPTASANGAAGVIPPSATAAASNSPAAPPPSSLTPTGVPTPSVSASPPVIVVAASASSASTPAATSSASAPPASSSPPPASLSSAATPSALAASTSAAATPTSSITGTASLGAVADNSNPSITPGPPLPVGGARMATGTGIAIGVALCALVALVGMGVYVARLHRRVEKMILRNQPGPERLSFDGGEEEGEGGDATTPSILAASAALSSPRSPSLSSSSSSNHLKRSFSPARAGGGMTTSGGGSGGSGGALLGHGSPSSSQRFNPLLVAAGGATGPRSSLV